MSTAKKMISVFLCIAMCLSLLPGYAFAEDNGQPTEDISSQTAEEPPESEGEAESHEPDGGAVEPGEESGSGESLMAEGDAMEVAGDEPTDGADALDPEASSDAEEESDEASDVSGTCGEGLTWTLVGGVLTISGAGAMDNYSSASAPWSGYLGEITSVVIESGVTSISDCAFARCTALTSVVISDGVITIGKRAFGGCGALTAMDIPGSVTSIEGTAFSGCYSLASVNVAESNPVYSSVDGVLFSKDKTVLISFPSGKSVDYYTVPAGVTSIGDSSLSGHGFSGVSLPESLASIGANAFYACSNLASIDLPENLTNIGNYAFANSGLTSIVIPCSVTSYAEGIFMNCHGLKSAVFEKGIAIIGANAFYGCSSLQSLTVPETVTAIYYGAFSDCSSLADVYYGGTEAQWNELKGSIADGNESLLNANIHYSEPDAPVASGVCGENLTWTLDADGVLTVSGTGAIPPYPETFAPWHEYAKKITSVVIESGVTSIGISAFKSCSMITSVSISNSVASIDSSAFFDCASLLGFTVANDNLSFSTLDGVLFSKDQTALIYFPPGRGGSYAIPNGVTNVKDYAFFGCGSSPTSISVPASVTSIGYSAFACSGILAEISVADANPNYSSIDGVLFNKDQTTLICCPVGKSGSYTVPETVTSIESSAFEGCGHLSSISLPEGVTSIGHGAFFNCYSLTSLNVPAGVTSIAWYTFYDCRALSSLSIPVGVASIGESAFYGCSSLTDVNYGGTEAQWNELKSSIADGNESLLNANIHYSEPDAPVASGTCGESLTWTLDADGVLTVSGTGAIPPYPETFAPWHEYAKKITSVVIESGVTSIGISAFKSCSMITSVSISNSVASIDSSAFFDCASLLGFTVANDNLSFSTLDGVLFSKDQTALIYFPPGRGGSYAIPNGVTNVKDYAFFGCGSSPTSISVPASVTSIGYSAFKCHDTLAEISVADANPNYSSIDGVLFNKDQTTLIYCPVGKSGSYTVPETVTSIESSAFEQCRDLSSISLPEGVTSIGHGAFFNCYSLTSLNVPAGVTSIAWYTFYDCRALSSLSIPVGVASIGESAFYGCSSLTDVNYGGTEAQWNELKSSIADGNESLLNANIHYSEADAPVASGTCGENLTWTLDADGVLTVSGTGAMDSYPPYSAETLAPWHEYTEKITSVVIESGVTSIGYFAFNGCSMITSVSISDSVTSIDPSTFFGCTSLHGFTVAEDNLSFSAFDGVLFNKDQTSLIYFPTGRGVSSYDIPDGVASIGTYAFFDCTLVTVSVPETVTGIDYSAFACSGILAEISVADGNPNYSSIDGVLFNKDQTALICCPAGKAGNYTVPETVTSIEVGAFESCGHLSSISLPESITSIKNFAFNGCYDLISINIPVCVTSIGEYAFSGCYSLTSINIPVCVTSIGEYAFSGCCSLADVYYGGTQAQWNTLKGSIAGNNDELLNANIHVSDPRPAAPKLSISKSNGKVKLSWDEVPGASKYWIYRCTDGVNFKYYDTITGTSYTNSSVTSGTRYYYKVKAVATVAGTDWASELSDAKSTVPVATPSLSISKRDGKVKLSWTAVTGAAKYWVYRSTDGVNFKYYDVTTNTTYTNSSVTSGTRYYYKVKAVAVVNDVNWAGDLSAVKSTVPVATPKLSISKSNGKVKLSWDEVPGASKYWIYRCTDGVNFKYYDTITGTTYTNSSVTSGTKYYYKIKAIATVGGTDWTGDLSDAKSTVPVATSTLSISKSDGKVKLSWTAVTGATKYWIYRSTDGKTFKYYDSTTRTTYTNSSVTSGTMYYYRVKAVATVNSIDWTGDLSNIKYTVPVATPVIGVSKSDGQVSVNWESITGAAKYWIYRSTDGEDFKYYATSRGPSYTDSSVAPGTEYFYKVKAVATLDGTDWTGSLSSAVSIIA